MLRNQQSGRKPGYGKTNRLI